MAKHGNYVYSGLVSRAIPEYCNLGIMDLEGRKNIALQMAVAANQLDILAAMLIERPDKAAKVRNASDMLAEWECEILSDTADDIQ